jgi:hypothetical protein
MLAAIDLHDKALGVAGEVDDETSDANLASEMRPKRR